MKRIISLIIAVIMVFSSATVLAEGKMENFKTKNTYSADVYNDVSAEEWYLGSVKKCYELALMLGNGDGRFNPEGNVTIAEVLTMASRVHSIYNGGDGIFDTETGNNWYDGIVSYAVQSNIIQADSFTNYERAATRAEMAYIFANALPTAELNVINKNITAPDVKNTDKYYSAILNLYKAGVVVGSDDKHNFLPDSNIIRAEAAAIICRVADKSERITLKEEAVGEDKAPISGSDDKEIEDEFIDEEFSDEYDDEFPEDDTDFDEYIPEEDIAEGQDEPMFDVEGVDWGESVSPNLSKCSTYVVDEKTGIVSVNVCVFGSCEDEALDMNKIRIGYVENDVMGTEGISFIDMDVTLQGQYIKCETIEELDSPGEYYAYNKVYRTEKSSYELTDITVYLAEVDKEAIGKLDKIEKIGVSIYNPFVFIMAEDCYDGSKPQGVVVDLYNKVITINDYDASIIGGYYAANYRSDGQNSEVEPAYYITDGTNMKLMEISEDGKIEVNVNCKTITFNVNGEQVVIDITDDLFTDGLDMSQLIG